MSVATVLLTIVLAVLPISELRGAIPFAVLRGMGLWPAALIGIAANALVPVLAFSFLGSLHKLFYRLGWYKRLFDRFVEQARIKVRAKVEKYGYWGLLVFVAIPLPVTGAWTGTLGAWVLDMDRKKATLAIMGGVLTAGIIVSVLVAVLGAGARSIFFKAF